MSDHKLLSLVKLGKIRLVLSHVLLKEAAEKPDPNKRDFLLEHSKDRIFDCLPNICLREALNKKHNKPWLLPCSTEKALRNGTNARNLQAARRFSIDSHILKMDIKEGLSPILGELATKGQRAVQRYLNEQTETLILGAPNIDDFEEFHRKTKKKSSDALRILVARYAKPEKRAASLEKLEAKLKSLDSYRYLRFFVRTSSYAMFSSIYKSRLHNHVDHSIIYDNQYLPLLYEVDYLVSNDRYCRQAPEYLFNGERVGKVISVEEYKLLVSRLWEHSNPDEFKKL